MQCGMRRLWLVLLVACGGGKGGGAGSAGGAAQASLEQTCATAFECQAEFPDGGSSFEQLFGTSEAACIAKLEDVFSPADVQASVAAGRIIYDPGDAQVCLDAREAVTCAQFWGTDPLQLPPECETAFVGTVPTGGTCTIELDCAGGGTCNDQTQVCESGADVVFVDELGATDQALLCEDFLDAFCAVPGNSAFCDDACISTGCTPAAEGGALTTECASITVDEVLDCGTAGTDEVCTGGPGCIADALVALCAG
jgi:hypothetical protein